MFSCADTKKGTYKVYAPYRLFLFYFISISVLFFLLLMAEKFRRTLSLYQ